MNSDNKIAQLEVTGKQNQSRKRYENTRVYLIFKGHMNRTRIRLFCSFNSSSLVCNRKLIFNQWRNMFLIGKALDKSQVSKYYNHREKLGKNLPIKQKVKLNFFFLAIFFSCLMLCYLLSMFILFLIFLHTLYYFFVITFFMHNKS